MTNFNEQIPVIVEGMKCEVLVTGYMKKNHPVITNYDCGDLDMQTAMDNHLDITSQVYSKLKLKYEDKKDKKDKQDTNFFNLFGWHKKL